MKKKEAEINALNILESMADAFVCIDFDWKYIYANEKALAATGKPHDELIGKIAWDVFPEIVGTVFEQEYRKAMTERIKSSFEIFYPPVDLWLLVRALPSEQGIFVFYTDITERKRTEEALIKSEELFSKAFRYGPGILSISRLNDGCYLDINDSFLETYGYKREEVIGKTSIEIGLYRDPDQRKEVVRLLKTDGFIRNYEIPLVSKNGKVVYIQFSMELENINNEDYIIGVGLDITELKKVYEELRESNERFEVMFNSSPAAISVGKLDGTITNVNESFVNMTGYTREEIIGHTGLELGIIKGGEERVARIDKIVNSKATLHTEIIIYTKGKRPRDVIYSAQFIKLGNEGHIIVTLIDNSERKNAERELRLLNSRLEKKVMERTLELNYSLEKEKGMNEMKSQFVSMASHEFRTPLSVILSSTGLLSQYTRPEDGEKRKKHTDRIISSVKNLTDILDDFLSLDKLEQGMMDVRKSDFNLKEFSEDLVEKFQQTVKNGQKINYIHEGTGQIYLDDKILRNIMTNLISNAIKYSPEGAEIDVETNVSEHGISILVKDHGIGIPEQEQKHIFGKFFRARNAFNIQGTGLGLNIVKKYVELLDGKISFTSNKFQGTSFVVEFEKEE